MFDMGILQERINSPVSHRHNMLRWNKKRRENGEQRKDMNIILYEKIILLCP